MVNPAKNIVSCPHCFGEGVCYRGTHRRSFDSNPWAVTAWWECSGCGKGAIEESYDAKNRPICKVCKGRGFNEIRHISTLDTSSRFDSADVDKDEGFDKPFFEDFDF
jgi:DnaJ-class molecular chaperone